MRSVLLIALLVAFASAQCANYTRIYSFEEFDFYTFLSFKQSIPTTLTFRKGWFGMKSQLRLTTYAQTQDVAQSFFFQIIGGTAVKDPKAAFVLEVVPPTEDGGDSSDASTMSSILATSVKAAAAMAVLSGDMFQSAVAESYMRQACPVKANVDLIMAPYFYDDFQAAVLSGAIKVEATSYKFENNTGSLDVEACKDTNVQSTYFQSCDKILTSYGLGLSSAEDLAFTEVVSTFNANDRRQVCSLGKLKESIKDEKILQVFSCDWRGTAYTSGYCGGETYASFDFKAYATAYSRELNPANKATYDQAAKKLQDNLEYLGGPWSDFARMWVGDNYCVDWQIDLDDCAAPGKGCPPDTLTCCSNSEKKCVPLEEKEDGNCDGTDYGNWTEPADDATYERSLDTRASGLCGTYAGKRVFSIHGNGGRTFQVVKILKPHLSDPSAFGASPNEKDNTMSTRTACAFSKLRAGGLRAGVSIKINSGFRTITRQKFFWHCFQCKCCNGGNLAARPGTSNHGWGIALDLNTAAGGVLNFMNNRGRSYGFVRTVPSENWHWEYRP